MTEQPCPVCGEPASSGADNAQRPFCSRACRERDLANWLDGDYRIPGPPVPTEALGVLAAAEAAASREDPEA